MGITTPVPISPLVPAFLLTSGQGPPLLPILEIEVNILAYLPEYVGYDHNAGAELTMHELLYALRLRGHHITVLLSDKTAVTEAYVIDGIKVQPYASKRDINYMARDFDLIITHLHAAERATLLANILGIKSVQYVHNSHISTHVALSADPSLAVFNTEWLQAEMGHRGNQLVVHPAVRPANYKTTRGKKVTLINLWRNKGVELFYELARRNPDIEFLGVMGGYEKQVVLDLPNVTIVPNLEDVRQAYEMTKVLLVPSAYESYGRVALEAAASGIPVLASPTLGLKEALGEAGTYVDAPQTSIPGGDPGPWSDSHIDAWNVALKKMLTPASFGKKSKLALERSAEVWEGTKAELAAFCNTIERL